MEAWTKHITGATALMQLRGKQALKTPLGYQMFIHLRVQVVSWLKLSQDPSLMLLSSRAAFKDTLQYLKSSPTGPTILISKPPSKQLQLPSFIWQADIAIYDPP
jgi:hypothetical protein